LANGITIRNTGCGCFCSFYIVFLALVAKSLMRTATSIITFSFASFLNQYNRCVNGE
jgi:hypothetical protein